MKLNKELPSVVCICGTKGRYTHLKKLIRCFLEQNYSGKHILVIYNNGKNIYKLDNFELPSNKEILLVNNYIYKVTGQPYSNVGQVFNDLLNSLDVIKADIATHMDDDDLFLPNHISEGVKGLLKGGKKGYKPKQSWYISNNSITLQENIMEPSVFIDFDFLKSTGYEMDSAKYNWKWYYGLKDSDNLFIDPEGVPTFMYDWSGRIPVWKISGDPENPNNYSNHDLNSVDLGEEILYPISYEELITYEPKYYDLSSRNRE